MAPTTCWRRATPCAVCWPCSASCRFPNREVLRLRFQDELSYKDISVVTGHSVGNVGFLIHAGIKQLRRRLQADEPSIREGGERTNA